MVPKYRCWFKNSGIQAAHMVEWDKLKEFVGLGRLFDDSKKSTLFILMQSTGLKDKNGVEIFEGDLVKKFSNINKFTDDFAEDIEPIYVITSIVRDGACFKTTFKGVPSLVLDQNSMSMVEHMEVVGSIYENPELLEKANES
ncbi:YopX family protein [Enterococcus casseliflavus]|uniref:YopX family protein n=1 Tax=Enterococcus casseliflavus TaxID=37734 RepID=UPI0034D333C8